MNKRQRKKNLKKYNPDLYKMYSLIPKFDVIKIPRIDLPSMPANKELVKYLSAFSTAANIAAERMREFWRSLPLVWSAFYSSLPKETRELIERGKI